MTEEKPSSHERAPGSTTIAPEVLETIARLTALNVPGVVATTPPEGGVGRLFRRRARHGVHVSVVEEAVEVELYLILEHDTNVREVSRQVQAEVARAIEHMVGMPVRRVDVHIEDIHYNADGGGETA